MHRIPIPASRLKDVLSGGAITSLASLGVANLNNLVTSEIITAVVIISLFNSVVQLLPKDRSST